MTVGQLKAAIEKLQAEGDSAGDLVTDDMSVFFVDNNAEVGISDVFVGDDERHCTKLCLVLSC